jgi:tetratricopeptide (TPR) repeat protein
VEKLLVEPVAQSQPRTFVSWLAVSLPDNTPTQIQVLKQIQHAHPDDFWANHNLACTYQYRVTPPRLIEAIRYHTAALAVRRRNPAACVNLGNALRARGDLQEAAQAYGDAVEQQPDYVDALYALGHTQRERGKWDEAVICFGELSKLNPNDAQAHLFLGQTLHLQQKFSEPADAYHKAIQADPQFAPAYNCLGAILCDQLGKYEEAAKCFQKVIDLNPRDADARFYLGLTHFKLANALLSQKKYAAALTAYQQAIVWNSEFADAHHALAWLLVTCPDESLWNPERAIESASRAIELNEQGRGYRNTLGVAHYRAGHLQEAIKELNRSVKEQRGGENAVDAFFLAMAHWKLGQADEARQWHQKAIDWMDNHGKEDPELHRFRKEAAALLGAL